MWPATLSLPRAGLEFKVPVLFTENRTINSYVCDEVNINGICFPDVGPTFPTEDTFPSTS